MVEIVFQALNNELQEDSLEKNFLFGNGLNRSIPEIGQNFNYSSIISYVEIKSILDGLNSKLTPYKTNDSDFDLEKVIEIVGNSKSEMITKFIDNFVEKHPSYRDFKQYKEKLSLFIRKHDFSNIFTLNYDLFLYWTILYSNKLNTNNREYVDGFWYGLLRNDAKEQQKIQSKRSRFGRGFRPNIFYLHGTIFLYKGKQYKPKKIVKSNNDIKRNLKKYIQDNIDEHNFPLIVLEGNSTTKESIMRDKNFKAYGDFCKENLKQIKGLLLILGCSFEQDGHILKYIAENKKLEKIYLTITCDQEKSNISSKISEYCDVLEKITWVKIDLKNTRDNIWS